MKIIETCPKCGHDLVDLVIATYPPIPQKKCFSCGWEWTGEPEEVVRVPIDLYVNASPIITDAALNRRVDNYITERYVPMQPTDAAYNNSSCKYCSNNPINGGSGICHCILGQEAIY